MRTEQEIMADIEIVREIVRKDIVELRKLGATTIAAMEDLFELYDKLREVRKGKTDEKDDKE